MREILTGLAIVLIAVLTAALAVPYFVDWSGQRAAIEARLSQALGTHVGIEGPVSIRLLPRPVLRAERVRVGLDAGGAPILSAGRVLFELAPLSLLRGEFDFVEAALERPELRLSRQEGRLVLPVPGDPGGVKARLERLRVTNGRIVVPSPGQPDFIFGPVNLNGAAASLAGPFRADGSIDFGDGPAAFRLSTGAIEEGRMRLRLFIAQGEALPSADFDGSITFPRGETGLEPVLEGPLTLAGQIAPNSAPEHTLNWRLSGTMRAEGRQAAMEALELRLGTEGSGPTNGPTPGGLSLNGRLAVNFGERPDVEIVLKSPQIDFDRALSGEAGGRVSPLDLAERLLRRLRTDAALPAPATVRVELEPTPVTLGGETVGDFSGELRLAPEAAPRVKLATSLPGTTKLALDGHVEAGIAPRFLGHVEIASQDAGRLRDWLVAGAAAPPQWLAAPPPFRRMELAGEAEASAAGFRLSAGRIALDRSRLTGAFSYTGAQRTERARLFADLRSDALDLDGAPDLSSLLEQGAALDLNLAMEARAVRLARVGTGLLEAGRISFKLSRDAEATVLERLSVTGLGGANLSGEGRLDAGGSRMQVDLDASRLTDLAELAARLFPSAASELFLRRAPRLSPARLNLRTEGAGRAMAQRFTLSGTAGGTRVEAEGALTDGALTRLRLGLNAPQAANLLRQFGLEAIPLQGAGSGRVTIDVTQGSERAQGVMSADLAGAALSYEGTVDPAPLLRGALPGFEGRLAAEAANGAPLLQVLGLLAPDPLAVAPFKLRARVHTRDGGLAVDDLAGEAFGGPLAGALKLGASEQPWLTGRLAFERIEAGGLFALVLGPPQPQRAGRGGLWSDLAFAVGLANLPSARIDVSAARLALGTLPDIREARARLDLEPGLLALSQISLPLEAGSFGGAVTLRRAGQEAAVSGRLEAKDVRLAWPQAAATLSGSIDFAGSGRNAAALMASLGGSGTARLRGLSVQGVAGEAMARVIAGVDKDRIEVTREAVGRALEPELDRGGFQLAEAEAPVTLASGLLRIGPLERIEGQIETSLQAGLDLKTMQTDWRAKITDRRLPRLWTGSPPTLDLLWRGAPEARREVDSGAFFNGLAARQIVREMEKIEALEADIRERAFFNRRLKADQFLRRREQEIHAYEAEQARLAAEAERKRAEEEARRAEEERRQEEARRREEERRHAEEERARREAEAILRQQRPADPPPRPAEIAPAGRAPMILTPAAPVPAPAGRAPNVPDPSAAGRY